MVPTLYTNFRDCRHGLSSRNEISWRDWKAQNQTNPFVRSEISLSPLNGTMDAITSIVRQQDSTARQSDKRADESIANTN